MLEGSARAFEHRLQRELDAPTLRCRWNRDLERFQIGAERRNGVIRYVEWILVVRNADGSFRQPDWRDIAAVWARDSAKHRAPTEAEALAADKAKKGAEAARRIEDHKEKQGDRIAWHQRQADDLVGGGAVSKEEKIARAAKAEADIQRLVENPR